MAYLQLVEALDVVEVLEPVVLDLEALQRGRGREGLWVQLADLVAVHVQLLQAAQLLEALDPRQLVLGHLEDLELLEAAVLQAGQLLERVAVQIEDLEVLGWIEEGRRYLAPVESLLERDVGGVGQGVDLVLREDEDAEVGHVAEHARGGEEVEAEVELDEAGEVVVVEDVLEVAQLAAGEVQRGHLLHVLPVQALLQDLLSQPPREQLLGLRVVMVLLTIWCSDGSTDSPSSTFSLESTNSVYTR